MKRERIKFKSDKYKKSRGGYSRLLDVSCEKCNTRLFHYQKDGPGMLKRVYLDRILGLEKSKPQLKCSNCRKHIGVLINYKKENRLAYRLFQGSITKKIVKLR